MIYTRTWDDNFFTWSSAVERDLSSFKVGLKKCYAFLQFKKNSEKGSGIARRVKWAAFYPSTCHASRRMCRINRRVFLQQGDEAPPLLNQPQQMIGRAAPQQRPPAGRKVTVAAAGPPTQQQQPPPPPALLQPHHPEVNQSNRVRAGNERESEQIGCMKGGKHHNIVYVTSRLFSM